MIITLTGILEVVGECIMWGDGVTYFGIYTPVSKFTEMFWEVITQALEDDSGVEKAIRDIDPENDKGFNEFL